MLSLLSSSGIFICAGTSSGDAEFYWGYQTSIHQIAESSGGVGEEDEEEEDAHMWVSFSFAAAAAMNAP